MHKDSNVVEDLIDAISEPKYENLRGLGVDIGKLYTNYGFPVDIAINKLIGYRQTEKLAVLQGVCEWFMEHKRKSGASENALDRQRKSNKRMLENFIKRKEVGVY